MAQKTTALRKIESLLGSDCQTCKMRIVGGNGQDDCLMEAIRSQWSEPFEDSSYCSHPEAKQFVDFINSSLPR